MYREMTTMIMRRLVRTGLLAVSCGDWRRRLSVGARSRTAGAQAAPAAGGNAEVRVRDQQFGRLLEHRREGDPEGRAGFRHQGAGVPPAQGRARRAAALHRRRDGDGLPGHGGQPGQSRFDDGSAEQGRREDAGHLSRLRRAQVEARLVRRHQQRRGGARGRRRGAEGAGRERRRARSRCSSAASTCRTRSSAARASRRC